MPGFADYDASFRSYSSTTIVVCHSCCASLLFAVVPASTRVSPRLPAAVHSRNRTTAFVCQSGQRYRYPWRSFSCVAASFTSHVLIVLSIEKAWLMCIIARGTCFCAISCVYVYFQVQLTVLISAVMFVRGDVCLISEHCTLVQNTL